MEGPSSTSHFRSISLPSRLPNPSCIAIEAKINELKAWGDLVSSSETIQSGLVGLTELYVCVDELVRSPHTQQALSRHRRGTLVEEALEGSIMLLDSCSVLKELIMQIKENVQVLQSALRRKGGDSTVANDVATYLLFRKKAKKSVIKSLRTLRCIEKKVNLISSPDVDHHVSMVIKVLGEVNAITISLFKTLLVFLSVNHKPTNGLQLLSMLGLKGTSTHEKDKMFVNEVETVDMVTMSLYKSAQTNQMKDADVQKTRRKLQILDVSIDGFEAGLNCLFRRLIDSIQSIPYGDCCLLGTYLS